MNELNNYDMTKSSFWFFFDNFVALWNEKKAFVIEFGMISQVSTRVMKKVRLQTDRTRMKCVHA